jgi:hypothetical protein
MVQRGLQAAVEMRRGMGIVERIGAALAETVRLRSSSDITSREDAASIRTRSDARHAAAVRSR